MHAVTSPLLENENCQLEREFDSAVIVEKYSKNLSIDVTRFFSNDAKVSVYKCPVTGYRFYYPFDLAGDGRFYEQLQMFEWYYMPWKWEHDLATSYVLKSAKLLEVGCGRGEFLKGIHDRLAGLVSVSGLELNEEAVRIAVSEKLNVQNELIQDHAKRYSAYYDIVCAFQVLEHISDVKPFIDAQLKALKPGGKLIIGVPNNDSFTKYDWNNDILNMPPHHMGLWSRESLANLEKIFPMKVVEIHNEPLQSYHRDWYVRVIERQFFKKNRFIASLYQRLKLRKLLNFYAKYNASRIAGHSIVAVFRKM